MLDQVEIRFGVALGVLVASLFVAAALRVPASYDYPVILVLATILGAMLTRRLAALLGWPPGRS